MKRDGMQRRYRISESERHHEHFDVFFYKPLQSLAAISDHLGNGFSNTQN